MAKHNLTKSSQELKEALLYSSEVLPSEKVRLLTCKKEDLVMVIYEICMNCALRELEARKTARDKKVGEIFVPKDSPNLSLKTPLDSTPPVS